MKSIARVTAVLCGILLLSVACLNTVAACYILEHDKTLILAHKLPQTIQAAFHLFAGQKLGSLLYLSFILSGPVMWCIAFLGFREKIMRVVPAHFGNIISMSQWRSGEKPERPQPD